LPELLLGFPLPQFRSIAEIRAAVTASLFPLVVDFVYVVVAVPFPNTTATFLYPSVLMPSAHMLLLSELQCRTHYTPPSCTCRWAAIKFSMSSDRNRSRARRPPRRTTGIRGLRRVAWSLTHAFDTPNSSATCSRVSSGVPEAVDGRTERFSSSWPY